MSLNDYCSKRPLMSLMTQVKTFIHHFGQLSLVQIAWVSNAPICSYGNNFFYKRKCHWSCYDTHIVLFTQSFLKIVSHSKGKEIIELVLAQAHLFLFQSTNTIVETLDFRIRVHFSPFYYLSAFSFHSKLLILVIISWLIHMH